MTWLIRWFCGTFHGRVMWAGYATYECATCGRRWPVPWADAAIAPVPAQAADIRELERIYEGK